MRKRLFSMLLTGAMIASVFSSVPAGAQAAPAIPAEPNIVDPAQDANGINDQGTGQGVGDNSTPAYFGGPDFLNIWFTNTAETLEVHFNTSGNPEGGNYAWLFRVWVNEDCQTLEANFTGATNPTLTESTAQIREWCGDAENVPGEIVTEEIEDGTFITTVTLPLGQNSGVAMGSTLTDPDAVAHTVNPAVLLPVMDTTVVGTEYAITEGGEPPVVEEPEEDPGKKDEAPAKKGCKKKKGKGKKKGCDKGKGPKEEPKAGCAAYVPGEEGAEAETSVVTDEHTEEAPLELTIEQGPGLVRNEVARSHVFANIQVDSDAAEAGLFVRYSFPDYEDHDLYVNYADGTVAAQAAGFNPVVEAPLINDGTSISGHSERGAEQVDGVRTADCAGYTADFDNFLGEGGEYTVTMWLGEIQNDPAAPAA